MAQKYYCLQYVGVQTGSMEWCLVTDYERSEWA